MLRLALLSTAQINDEIIRAAAASELVSIVGAASRDPARAEAYVLELLAGEPDAVFGEQTLAPRGVDVRFAGTLRFADGVLGQFSCGLDTAPSQALEAVGSEGSLLVSHPFTADVERVELRRGETLEELEVEHRDRYGLQLENFARAIRGDEPPLLGRDNAVAQARTLDGLSRSAETGLPATP